MEKVVVTGGAGFIGSHLVEKLLNDKHDITIIDDFSTGLEENLYQASKFTNLDIIRGDCADDGILAYALQDASVVFHLAARVGVERVLASPLATIEENLRLTKAVAKAAIKADVRMVVTSTSEVYGRNENVPFSEDDDLTLGPPNVGRWSYAASKILDEHLLLALAKESGLRVTIARVFNTVGPNQVPDYGMVLPRFITASLRHDTLKVYGNGSQQRCFTWVHDAVRALILMSTEDSCLGEVYNVGSDSEISILDLASRIIEITGTGKIEFIDEKTLGKNYADMQRRIPDISKINKAVSWNPQIGIDDIIKLTIEWWKNKIH